MKRLTISLKGHCAYNEQELFFTKYIRRNKDCNEWWVNRYKPIEEKQWNEHLKSSL